MIIREIYNKILHEMDSGAATNNVGDGAVALIDPIIKLKKVASVIDKLRRPINPTLVRKDDGKTGPIKIPSDNPVTNSLNNGNKGPEQNPLNLLKYNPVMNIKRPKTKQDLRSRK